MTIFENKYEILNALGIQKTRKFGSTFLIKNRHTEKLCVLKTVPKTAPQLVIDCLFSEKEFIFEHCDLPQTLDFFETETEYQWIKPYINGEELGEFWKSIKRRDRFSSLIEICKALAPIFDELQEKKIVHCDVKASNIIVSKIEGKISATLIDFGMAIQQDNLPNRGTLFSLAYASPEIILNQLSVVNQQSDFYSLGVLFYQLHCNTLPFHNAHPAIMTQLSITYPLPKHTKLSVSHYSFLKTLCTKHQFSIPPNKMDIVKLKECLRVARDKRFIDFTEIMDALTQVTPKKIWF
jgi:serine/threonine protein kinase